MMGNRVQKKAYDSNGNLQDTINMLYDRYDCVADYDDSDELQRYYITPFMDENMVLTDASSGTPSMDLFYAQDGLGTVRQIFDATSSLVNNYDYEGFGTETSTTGALYNRYRFTGREIDEETQTADSTALYYYRARTYDTTIGSFTSRDPIPYVNLYPYCSANPINFTDPTGSRFIHANFKNCKKCAENYIRCMLSKVFAALTNALRAILHVANHGDYLRSYGSPEFSTQQDRYYMGRLTRALNASYSIFDESRYSGPYNQGGFNIMNNSHSRTLDNLWIQVATLRSRLTRFGVANITCNSSSEMDPAAGSADRENRYSRSYYRIRLNMGYFCRNLRAYPKFGILNKSREMFNASTLMHELSHFFQHTTDWDPSSHTRVDPNRVDLFMGKGPRNKWKWLSPNERVNHADSLTRFLMAFYPEKPECKIDSECCGIMGESTK